MKKAEKEKLEIIIGLFSEHVKRSYGISDDDEPYIQICGRDYPCSGVYELIGYVRTSNDFAKHCITFKPSSFEQYGSKSDCDNLIYHELGHWVQQVKSGATQCQASFAHTRTANFTLIDEHTKIMKEIKEIAKKFGFVDFHKIVRRQQ